MTWAAATRARQERAEAKAAKLADAMRIARSKKDAARIAGIPTRTARRLRCRLPA
ncbi:hypothetical protein [Sphingomonas sp. OV641]|uniref:hypothetical protein n=1 Tax=Sphingomonas sp. OV641 TaxID=1881068 RepID=UPI0015A57D51|nr:hypothetical protein [Sphingomonas sp. OV641]